MWGTFTNTRETQSIKEISVTEMNDQTSGNDDLSLAQAKTHWLSGEWHRLVVLNADSFQTHPDRDRLALLVAGAHQQLGNHEQARKYSRMALDWGCPSRTVAQVLIAGVHNTLARAASLKQDKKRTSRHFEAAVAAIGTRDVALASHACSVREMTRMGLLTDAAGLVDNNINRLADAGYGLGKQNATIELIRQEQRTIKAELSKEKRGLHSDAGHRLILVASIPRSGSTWLYNCVKQILTKYNQVVYSCWVEDYNPQDEADVHLVKAHYPDPELAERADVIFTSRRDMREVAASLVRMGWGDREKGLADQIQRFVNVIHPFWYERSSLEVEYKQILRTPKVVIEQVGHALGCHLSLEYVRQLENYLSQMGSPEEYDKETQLHPNHRSLENASFDKILDPEKTEMVTRIAEGWLVDYGYVGADG